MDQVIRYVGLCMSSTRFIWPLTVNWPFPFWFRLFNFSFPLPNVLKFLNNAFDHNTHVKFVLLINHFCQWIGKMAPLWYSYYTWGTIFCNTWMKQIGEIWSVWCQHIASSFLSFLLWYFQTIPGELIYFASNYRESFY